MIWVEAAMLGVLGMFLGSFVGAQVWRLRARQLVEDKAAGERIPNGEFVRLKTLLRPVATDRSECLYCHHSLAWHDLMPVVSWLSLGGRCRYCRQSIGIGELAVELGLGVAFAVSYMYWPGALHSVTGYVCFALWLVACVLMAILFIYDARWYLLPFAINFALVIVGGIFALLILGAGGWQWKEIMSLFAGVAILAGLYFFFSCFGWVGLGDSILGVGLSLLLTTWQQSLLALFLANALGCVFLLPIAMRGKLKRSMHIPFGPFMILGAFVSFLWGHQLVEVIFRVISMPLVL